MGVKTNILVTQGGREHHSDKAAAGATAFLQHDDDF